MSAPQPVAVDARWHVHLGDCVAWLLSLPEASVDAIVCDPPYGLGFMGKAWDALPPGKAWAEACLRALKPGGHLVAFGGTRTVHRLMCAVEDGGFEIRDQVGWVYFNGFPKNLDVSKAIDAAAGAERPVIGRKGLHLYSGTREARSVAYGDDRRSFEEADALTAPATPDAERWAGFGTALKPAVELAVLARRPLIETVVRNVLQYGTGALNIDGCRFAWGDPAWIGPDRDPETINRWVQPNTRGQGRPEGVVDYSADRYADGDPAHVLGRFPANLYYCPKPPRKERERGCDGLPAHTGAEAVDREEGSAGLRNPRAGAGRMASTVRNPHPCVKPVALMRWLCRLVTPPGGLVVDPFTGSGSTGIAALLEGFRFAGAEMEPDYHQIACARIAHAAEHPEEWGGKRKPKKRPKPPAEAPTSQVLLFGGGAQ